MAIRSHFLFAYCAVYLSLSLAENVCTTNGCVKAAGTILSTYDPNADPCEDFYQFACGKWLEDNVIPDDTDTYGVFQQVADQVTKELRVLLENDIPLSIDSVAINMTRRFYRECTNTEKLVNLKSASLFKIINKLGGMPLLNSTWNSEKFDFNKMMAIMKRDYANDPIFYIAADIDQKNTSRYLLNLDEPGLGMGSRDFYLNDTLYGDRVKAYKKLIEDIFNLIASDANIKPLPVKKFNHEINEMVDFERKLAQLTLAPEDRRNDSQQYNKYSLAGLKKLVPEIDWDLYFHESFPRDVFAVINDQTEIIVAVPQFYASLGPLLKQTDPKTLANYFIWSMAYTITDYLDERFGDIVQQYKKSTEGRDQKPLRWKTCIKATEKQLDVAAGAIYVDQNFDVNDKIEIDKMVDNLLATMSKMIKDLNWMDEQTKNLAQEKVKNIIKQLGYPDFVKNATALDKYYKELSISEADSYLEMSLKAEKWAKYKNLKDLLKPFDRYRFERNAAIVNAFYNPSTNAIVFPAGFLRPPFFKSSYPKYINYGSMGSVIGHEITHGFDDIGSQYDKVGKLENWWSDNASQEFLKRVQCIIDQFGAYEVPEIKRNINGKLTQGENVADSGGIKEAFRAYQKYLIDSGTVEPTLPGLNLTNEQAFFVSFATFWCQKMKPEEAVNRILSDNHSPARFRVFGTLSNTKEFASAFNCKPNAKLNPSKRCEVW